MDKPNVWLAIIARRKNESARCDIQTFTILRSVLSPCYQHLILTQHNHSTWSFKIDDDCDMVFLVLIDIKITLKNQPQLQSLGPWVLTKPLPTSSLTASRILLSLQPRMFVPLIASRMCCQRRDTSWRLRDLRPTRYPRGGALRPVLGILAAD